MKYKFLPTCAADDVDNCIIFSPIGLHILRLLGYNTNVCNFASLYHTNCFRSQPNSLLLKVQLYERPRFMQNKSAAEAIELSD